MKSRVTWFTADMTTTWTTSGVMTVMMIVMTQRRTMTAAAVNMTKINGRVGTTTMTTMTRNAGSVIRNDTSNVGFRQTTIIDSRPAGVVGFHLGRQEEAAVTSDRHRLCVTGLLGAGRHGDLHGKK